MFAVIMNLVNQGPFMGPVVFGIMCDLVSIGLISYLIYDWRNSKCRKNRKKKA